MGHLKKSNRLRIEWYLAEHATNTAKRASDHIVLRSTIQFLGVSLIEAATQVVGQGSRKSPVRVMLTKKATLGAYESRTCLTAEASCFF